MAYLHQVEFQIGRDQSDELHIGASLERVLGFLRTLLPNMPGYITSNAYTTIENIERVHLLVTSTWESWQDLKAHQESSLAEVKILEEFDPALQLIDLTVRVFREVD